MNSSVTETASGRYIFCVSEQKTRDVPWPCFSQTVQTISGGFPASIGFYTNSGSSCLAKHTSSLAERACV